MQICFIVNLQYAHIVNILYLYVVMSGKYTRTRLDNLLFRQIHDHGLVETWLGGDLYWAYWGFQFVYNKYNMFTIKHIVNILYLL